MMTKSGRQLLIQTDALGRVHMRTVLHLCGKDRATVRDLIKTKRFPEPANSKEWKRGERYFWSLAAIEVWVAEQPGA